MDLSSQQTAYSTLSHFFFFFFLNFIIDLLKGKNTFLQQENVYARHVAPSKYKTKIITLSPFDDEGKNLYIKILKHCIIT